MTQLAAAGSEPTERPAVSAHQKDQSIETLRGVAVVLMVAGHVIGSGGNAGLRVADGSWLEYFYYSFEYLRMPLFTVISGYVYSLRPVEAGMLGRFTRGKMRRILLPFAVVGTLQYLARATVPGANSPADLTKLWHVFVYGTDQFWFLQAIFAIFMTIMVVDRFGGMSTRWRWLGCMAIALMMSLWLPRVGYFSMPGYLRLLPYFVLGCGLYRFPEELLSPRVVGPAVVALALGLMIQQAMWVGWIDPNRVPVPYLRLVVGLTGILVLFMVRFPWPPLAWMGAYAYSIYLFHIFGTAGGRIAATRILQIDDIRALFLLSLICGLAFPILVERLVRSVPYLRTALLGLR